MPIIRRRRAPRRMTRRKRAPVAKLARQVRGLVRSQEKKYFNAEISNVNIPVAGTITSLSSVPQGDTAITRDGNHLTCQKFSFNASILPDFNDSMTTVRIVVFRWSAVSAPVVLTSTNATTGVLDDSTGGTDPWSPLNQVAIQAGYLKPIKDYLWNYISATSAATPVLTPSTPKTIRFSRKYKNLPLEYPTTATGQANKNNFFVLFMSTEVTNPPVLYLSSQLLFHDS